ncbi:hypothetical protein [Candidatus Spongiihabitans sp.]|uniref:hypothetical protein n=1 Tax=Candidatus Spongiihabitans sp. TaxID=3101308 RepID=UPI003C7E3EEB
MRGPIHPPALERSVRRVLAAQALLAILLVAVVLATTVWSDPTTATLSLARVKAVAFGSLLGILATVITARSVIKSSQAATEHSPKQGHGESNASAHLGMLPLYSGLLFKLLLVAGGAFVGLAYLQLGPLYIALGYITMQAGYIWAASDHKRAPDR